MAQEEMWTFRVSSTDVIAALVEHIVNEWRERITDMVDMKVTELVETAVFRHTEREVEKQVTDAVRTALAEGFSVTDTWGTTRGKTSLPQMVTELLTKKERRGYDGPERTKVEQVVTTAVEELWRGDFSKHATKLKELFTEEMHAKLAAALAKTIVLDVK